jgi:preprotein translocase subunit YajC
MLHPFYVKTKDGGDRVAASNLTKGDEVLTEDGRVVYVENVQVEKLDKKIKVYFEGFDPEDFEGLD